VEAAAEVKLVPERLGFSGGANGAGKGSLNGTVSEMTTFRDLWSRRYQRPLLEIGQVVRLRHTEPVLRERVRSSRYPDPLWHSASPRRTSGKRADSPSGSLQANVTDCPRSSRAGFSPHCWGKKYDPLLRAPPAFGMSEVGSNSIWLSGSAFASRRGQLEVAEPHQPRPHLRQ
jgi:hypothetical protein